MACAMYLRLRTMVLFSVQSSVLLVLLSVRRVVGWPVLGFGASQAARHSLGRHLYRADFTCPTHLAL